MVLIKQYNTQISGIDILIQHLCCERSIVIQKDRYFNGEYRIRAVFRAIEIEFIDAN